MRIFYTICSVIASLANIALIVLFVKKLRVRLAGRAWACIITSFCFVLYNNLVISFIVIERPRASIVLYLLISFFLVKVAKNTLWLIGFWVQYKEFDRLENLDEYILSITPRQKQPISKELVEDLKGNENKSSRNKPD